MPSSAATPTCCGAYPSRPSAVSLAWAVWPAAVFASPAAVAASAWLLPRRVFVPIPEAVDCAFDRAALVAAFAFGHRLIFGPPCVPAAVVARLFGAPGPVAGGAVRPAADASARVAGRPGEPRDAPQAAVRCWASALCWPAYCSAHWRACCRYLLAEAHCSVRSADCRCSRAEPYCSAYRDGWRRSWVDRECW